MLLFAYESEGVDKIPLHKLVSDFRLWRSELTKKRLAVVSTAEAAVMAQFSLPFTSKSSSPKNGDEAFLHRSYEIQTIDQAQQEARLLTDRFMFLSFDEKLVMGCGGIYLAFIDRNKGRYDLHIRATLSGAGLLKEQS